MLSPDVILSTGRIVRHTRLPSGAQLGTPTAGPEELTDAEWDEYARKIIDRARSKRHDPDPWNMSPETNAAATRAIVEDLRHDR